MQIGSSVVVLISPLTVVSTVSQSLIGPKSLSYFSTYACRSWSSFTKTLTSKDALSFKGTTIFCSSVTVLLLLSMTALRTLSVSSPFILSNAVRPGRTKNVTGCSIPHGSKSFPIIFSVIRISPAAEFNLNGVSTGISPFSMVVLTKFLFAPVSMRKLNILLYFLS